MPRPMGIGFHTTGVLFQASRSRELKEDSRCCWWCLHVREKDRICRGDSREGKGMVRSRTCEVRATVGGMLVEKAVSAHHIISSTYLSPPGVGE